MKVKSFLAVLSLVSIFSGNVWAVEKEIGSFDIIKPTINDGDVRIINSEDKTRMTIEDGGDVGVGLKNPGSLLHLRANNPVIRIEDYKGFSPAISFMHKAETYNDDINGSSKSLLLGSL